jgi:hypothetical protein
LLALAVVALGSQAVAASRAHPLVQSPHPAHRLWSLFREGLNYFIEVVQHFTVCLDLIFIPDRAVPCAC